MPEAGHRADQDLAGDPGAGGEADPGQGNEQSLRKKAELERDRLADLLAGVLGLVEAEGGGTMEKIRDLTLAHRMRSGRRSKLLSPGGKEAGNGGVDITEEASVIDVADLSFGSCDDTNHLVELTHEEEKEKSK